MEYLFDNPNDNKLTRRFVPRQNLKNISDAYYKRSAAQGIGRKQRVDTGAAQNLAEAGELRIKNYEL